MASLDDRVGKCLANLCFIDCQSSAAAHRNYGFCRVKGARVRLDETVPPTLTQAPLNATEPPHADIDDARLAAREHPHALFRRFRLRRWWHIHVRLGRTQIEKVRDP